MPPNKAEAMLAHPCPTSSTFDLWRLPIMPSATTAERSDSMPHSNATVMAGEKSSRSRSRETAGIQTDGRAAWKAPNREPMVSTGR
jgi:hypothetical protein